MSGEAPVSCQNCDWKGTEAKTKAMDMLTIFERVSPGEIMPAGDCPECGACAHLDEALAKHRAPAPDVPAIRVALEEAQGALREISAGSDTGDYPDIGDMLEARDAAAGLVATALNLLGGEAPEGVVSTHYQLQWKDEAGDWRPYPGGSPLDSPEQAREWLEGAPAHAARKFEWRTVKVTTLRTIGEVQTFEIV